MELEGTPRVTPNPPFLETCTSYSPNIRKPGPHVPLGHRPDRPTAVSNFLFEHRGEASSVSLKNGHEDRSLIWVWVKAPPRRETTRSPFRLSP